MAIEDLEFGPPPVPNGHTTREGYLNAAAERMKVWISEYAKLDLPRVQISAGFGKGITAKAIGCCYDAKCTDDGTAQIMIWPTLKEDIQVLATLLHELVHACLGHDVGHKGPFKRAVRELGLEGKATATYAEPGTPLHDRLKALSEDLGPYPHSPIVRGIKPKRKPGGGWVKLRSASKDDYILRISPKSLREHGLPDDPWGEKMIALDEDGEPMEPGEDDGDGE